MDKEFKKIIFIIPVIAYFLIIFSQNSYATMICSKDSSGETICEQSDPESTTKYNPDKNKVGPLIPAEEFKPNDYLTLIEPLEQYPLTNNTEIYVISGYGPLDYSSKVIIDRPGVSIVVILISFSKIVWDIETTPQTNINYIIVAADEDTYIKSNRPFKAYKETEGFKYIDSINDGKFFELLNSVKKKFGRSKIDYFSGNYTIPEVITINNSNFKDTNFNNEILSIDYPQVQTPPINYQFTLQGEGGPVLFNLSGPVNNKNPIIIPPNTVKLTNDGIKQYKTGDNSILISDANEICLKEVKLPLNFPDFSFNAGIAYSPNSKLILIGSHDGGGSRIYRYDVANDKWKDFRYLNQLAGTQALIYDPYSNHFWGIDNFTGNKLYEMTDEGVPIKSISINKELPGYHRVLGSEGEPFTRVFMIPQKEHIILYLLDIDSVNSFSVEPSEVSIIWLLDKNTGKAILTYKNLTPQASSEPLPEE